MLRLVCSSHFSAAMQREKKNPSLQHLPPPFYLSPNEQFTWLVKEVVKSAKAEGKQRGGSTGVHFPQVELLSPVLQDLPLFPGASKAGCGRKVCVYTLCQTLKERMASIHNSKRETIFKMKEHAIKSSGRLPLFCPPCYNAISSIFCLWDAIISRVCTRITSPSHPCPFNRV